MQHITRATFYIGDSDDDCNIIRLQPVQKESHTNTMEPLPIKQNKDFRNLVIHYPQPLIYSKIYEQSEMDRLDGVCRQRLVRKKSVWNKLTKLKNLTRKQL